MCIYLHNNMDIEKFFSKLGFDEKTIIVLQTVIKLGAQPASIIAKVAKLDRTTTYRLLKYLCNEKLLAESKHQGVTVFYLEKLSDIHVFLRSKRKKLEELEQQYIAIIPQLKTMRSNLQELPKIQIYEGYDRLKAFYRDIANRATEQGLLLIRILGSNTFHQKLEQKELGEIIDDFKKDLLEKKIEADILIAQGNLTREWISCLENIQQMASLPAAGGATNVILVGESIFMVSFRDLPVGIRIDHPDIAQTMHFLFDICQKVKI